MSFKIALVLVVVAAVLLAESDACGRRKCRHNHKNKGLGIAFRAKKRACNGAFNVRSLNLPGNWFVNRIRIKPCTLRGRGRVSSLLFFYNDGGYGVFSYKVKRSGRAVRFFYKVFNNGKLVFRRVKVYRMKRKGSRGIRKLLRKFMKFVRKLERKRRSGVKITVIRRVINFKLKNSKGGRTLSISCITKRGKKIIGKFSKQFSFGGSVSVNQIASYLQQFNSLLESRYSAIVKLIFGGKIVVNTGNVAVETTSGSGNGDEMSESSSSSTTSSSSVSSSSGNSESTSYHKEFKFGASSTGGDITLNAECTISKDGKVIDTIKKSYTLASQDLMKAKIEYFKENECQLPQFS